MKQITNPRELRGLKILSEPDTIIPMGKNEWDVRSQSKDAYYHVIREYKDRHAQQRGQATWTCTCPDFLSRNVVCKHQHAVMLSLKISGEIVKDYEATQTEGVESNIICPTCKSGNVIKYGVRKTKFGENQRYTCNDCGYSFVVDQGFHRMKNSPKTITLTLDLYFKGVSLRKIADHLIQFEDVAVTQVTILRWIRKYLAYSGNTPRSIRLKPVTSGTAMKQPSLSRRRAKRNITSGSGTSWMQRPDIFLPAKSRKPGTLRMRASR